MVQGMSATQPNGHLVPPQWGGPLNEADYAALAASWITREIADAALLRRVDEREGREVIGQKGNRDCAGILIPYYWPGVSQAFNYRLRRDNPEWTEDKNGKLKPERKYLSPPNGANRLFIPPVVSTEQLADPQIPIALVEGEKKALALWRLANHEIGTLRFVPIALAGVWNWRGRIGKTSGQNGERVDVKGPIVDLSRTSWDGRRVFIVYDTNVHSNDSVYWARKGISRELTTLGADVKLVNLPVDCGVNGIDDLLAKWGPIRVLELFERAVSGGRLQVVVPPQFQSRAEGMFRVTSKGEGLTQVQLTNYQAAITTNIRLDDGVETRREFEIESELMGGKSRFTISASEFARMEWPIERIGSAAITFPSQKEYARTAIQSLSITAPERCIYTHTGWRSVGGAWIYLHKGGAINAAGAVPDIEVRLFGGLSQYELRPPTPRTLEKAVRASLRLLALGPPSVSFPLLAATCRAAFGGADFALHLAGETGAFKSEVAALHQQHFGAGMDRLHLPGAWSSTGNALEAMAFHAKDALFVIDDFAPHGSNGDVARYQNAAERVFRAAGNLAGRGRLDSTASLRESKPPRALILSTGEDLPRGQSVRARILILEISKRTIKGSELAECQRDARSGLYAEAMGGFLQWFAGRYDEARTTFDAKVSEHRAKTLFSATHARTPEIAANLQAAFELYVEFSMSCGALDVAEADRVKSRCWDAVREAAAAQAKQQGETEPTARFLTVLRSLLSTGRAHLAGRNGGEPSTSPESCGWRRDRTGNWLSLGDCIGWADEENVYLDSAAAYRAVQIAGRDVGDSLAVSEQTLKKRVHERALLASVDTHRGTLTVRRSIAGISKSVLHFLRATILPEVSDCGEDAE
jgi:hypothetical protein